MDKLKELLEQIEHPFFLYNLDFLNTHLDKIINDKPDFLDIWFACKANPLTYILNIIKNKNLGIDVASQGELDQARYLGFQDSRIISTGPAKPPRYLKQLMNLNVVVLESLNQALWLNEEAKKSNSKINVLLRLQLDWAQLKDQTSVLGGTEITPFGISPESWINSEVKTYSHLNILGTHAFQWGNILKPSELEFVWDHCLQASTQLANDIGFNLNIVDLGGGLGLDYEDPENRLDFNLICTSLEKLREKHSIPKIWLELGRYAVGECGSYFTQIIDRKTVRGQEILVVEGGINQLARPALTSQSFPCITHQTSSPTQDKTHFQVHGPLCTSLDKLGTFNLSSNITIGDWLEFKLCGAYGFTESMPFFLGHSLPGEVVLKDNSLKIIRHPESARSYLKLDY